MDDERRRTFHHDDLGLDVERLRGDVEPPGDLEGERDEHRADDDEPRQDRPESDHRSTSTSDRDDRCQPRRQEVGAHGELPPLSIEGDR